MNKLIFFLLISCSSCCGGYWKNRMDVIIENNSIHNIACFFPTTHIYPVENYPCKIYPDTTITFSPHFVQSNIAPHTSGKYVFVCYDNIEYVYDHHNTDTLSLFIFDCNIIESVTWSRIIEDYDILARYDLSREDMNSFKKDKNGMPVIPYPPTPEMKGIHMYPPNKELKKNNE